MAPLPRFVDLSQRIHTGMPAWVEMGGTFGLARSVVAVWEDCEEAFYAIENLCPWPAVLTLPRRFRVVAAPLAIEGATAAPCRVVALVA